MLPYALGWLALVGISDAEARDLLYRWLVAQNQGDFASYQSLYAHDFQGVRRSGSRTVQLDHDGWMRDRGRMFKQPMIVRVSDSSIEPAGDRVRIRFTQTFSSGQYRDVGIKELIVVREGSAVRIAREEMLSSKLVVTPADPSQPEKSRLSDPWSRGWRCLMPKAPEAIRDSHLERLLAESQTHLTSCLFLSGVKGVTQAGWALVGSLTQLNELNLSGSSISEAGLAGLKKLRGLRRLNLDETVATDATVRELAGLSALEELSLQRTKITNQGLSALGRLGALRRLILADTPLRAGAELPALPQLQYLNLMLTGVDDAILTHLSASVQLDELNLGRTKITSVGLAKLAALPRLKRLVLSGTAVGDAGMVHVAGLAQLEDLYLDDTKVTSKALRDLARLAGKLKFADFTGTRVSQPSATAALPKATLYFTHTTDD